MSGSNDPPNENNHHRHDADDGILNWSFGLDNSIFLRGFVVHRLSVGRRSSGAQSRGGLDYDFCGGDGGGGMSLARRRGESAKREHGNRLSDPRHVGESCGGGYFRILNNGLSGVALSLAVKTEKDDSTDRMLYVSATCWCERSWRIDDAQWFPHVNFCTLRDVEQKQEQAYSHSNPT